MNDSSFLDRVGFRKRTASFSEQIEDQKFSDHHSGEDNYSDKSNEAVVKHFKMSFYP